MGVEACACQLGNSGNLNLSLLNREFWELNTIASAHFASNQDWMSFGEKYGKAKKKKKTCADLQGLRLEVESASVLLKDPFMPSVFHLVLKSQGFPSPERALIFSRQKPTTVPRS